MNMASNITGTIWNINLRLFIFRCTKVTYTAANFVFLRSELEREIQGRDMSLLRVPSGVIE